MEVVNVYFGELLNPFISQHSELNPEIGNDL